MAAAMINRTFVVASALGIAVALVGVGRLLAQDGAAPAAAVLEQGSHLYGAQCSICHGENGTSIPGVDLGSGLFRHASSDEDLRRIIREGIPGTAMPPFALGNAERAAIVAYIRAMRSIKGSAPVLGDPDRGRAVFDG